MRHNKAKEAVKAKYNATKETISAVGTAAGEAVPVKHISLVALGVGMIVGIACYVLPHTTASVVGAIGATATAVGVQIGGWLKRAVRRVGLLT